MVCILCILASCMFYMCIFLLPLLAVALVMRTRSRQREGTVAFFHPYCNAGGGGERVLWCAINAMQKEYSERNLNYVVYTGDIDAKPEEILAKARNRFDISVDGSNLQFVFLRTRPWLEAKNYAHFTLLLQTLAGLIVGIEALSKVNPEVFIDTMGYPLTLPLFRWIAGSRVGCYVHYPTISTDMINKVESRESDYNNSEWIASNTVLSTCKLIYYRMFALFYRLCGKCAHMVMVNGSWTRGHVLNLWKMPESTFVVYPPCNVDNFLRLKSDAETLMVEKKQAQILSVGQIRPEKDHRLQIKALAELKKRLMKEDIDCSVRLVICGGCRNEEDRERASGLERYADELGLTKQDIEWALNAHIDSLCTLMQNSLIGFHTMHNEHFGISVVEGVAAGQIMIAHNSGGPKLDILNSSTDKREDRIGFLATTVEEYVESTLEIIRMSREERERMRENGRKSMEQFSDSNFEASWNDVVAKLLC